MKKNEPAKVEMQIKMELPSGRVGYIRFFDYRENFSAWLSELVALKVAKPIMVLIKRDDRWAEVQVMDMQETYLEKIGIKPPYFFI